jgi:hypothetical protein
VSRTQESPNQSSQPMPGGHRRFNRTSLARHGWTLGHRTMRPRFILTIMLITLAFLLILLCSPGLLRRKAVDRAVVAWHQDRSPEKEQAIRFEQDRARRGQYVVCSLAVLNAIGIVVYGGLQQRKRMA